MTTLRCKEEPWMQGGTGAHHIEDGNAVCGDNGDNKRGAPPPNTTDRHQLNIPENIH